MWKNERRRVENEGGGEREKENTSKEIEWLLLFIIMFCFIIIFYLNILGWLQRLVNFVLEMCLIINVSVIILTWWKEKFQLKIQEYYIEI